MSAAYNFALPSSVVWGDFAAKSYSADFDPSRNYLAEMDPTNSIIGSPLGLIGNASIQFADWPIKPIPEKYRQLQYSDVETLIISGNIDFSTPAEFATDELLPYLNRGKQVILSEIGHVKDVFYVRPKVTERLLNSFYATGIADDSLNTYMPMSFETEWGWPTVTKTTVGVGGGLLLLLFFL